VSRLGFSQNDFRIFSIEGFSARLQQIYERVRPRLALLGKELAPEIARGAQIEFFPHVATHARSSVNPPAETWVAWGPSPKGYRRYGYLALYISGAGVHARAVVKANADNRAEISRRVAARAAELEKSFGRTRIARYDNWEAGSMPPGRTADRALFASLADSLARKTGTIDVGFGWPVREAVTLDRADILDAFRELEPLYKILRSVV
jgi:uncharacterized protein YktB (UPF0637 family)